MNLVLLTVIGLMIWVVIRCAVWLALPVVFLIWEALDWLEEKLGRCPMEHTTHWREHGKQSQHTVIS